jgi:hypothetical protein
MRKHAIHAAIALAIGATSGAALAQSAGLTAATPTLGVAVSGGNPVPAAPVAVSKGRVNVIAFLKDDPLAVALTKARPADAPRKAVVWSAAQQRAYVANLVAKQDAVVNAANALGATYAGRVTNAANGVLFSIDAENVGALANLTAVATVMPVEDMQHASLSGTDDYVGATAARLRTPSIDGSGIRIAILDSGIDFTHFNLGGPGTPAAYQAAYGLPGGTCGPTPQNTTAPTWTAKVVGGTDFVGERWPTFSGALEPDPNPIDCQGHGSSVADIAAGRSADGSWTGIAPGASLYAVKVCSAVSTSCSGLGILQGLDWALDPNQDGDLSDAVDVVNMSLGANFGQRENPSVLFTQNVVRFGTVVSASAGNGGDVAFINGSPSSAPEAIAVAQTQIPGIEGYPLLTNATGLAVTTNTNYQPWSAPVAADIGGQLVADPNLTSGGCAPYAPGAFAGKIALISRGTCAVSIKTALATDAGAVGVVISDNVAAADPPSFSFGGGGTAYASTIVVTQAVGNALRTAVAAGAVNATISYAGRISLDGSMASTSSRGPNAGYVAIKPDIGAPGASLAATVGTGAGTANFGGTSGAAPVVTGAAALLLQSEPNLQVHEVKARLMGAADNNVRTNPLRSPSLAPVTRIGAGELRVIPALDSRTAMWDTGAPWATSLSFGYQASNAPRLLRKRLAVRNYSNAQRTYAIGTSYRYANDAASGGVTLQVPASVTVPANSVGYVNVQLTINPAGLPTWRTTGVNGGNNAAVGELLQSVEYDGYITLTSNGETTRLPWHVLPRRAHNAAAAAAVSLSGGVGSLALSNVQSTTGAPVDVFALTGTSTQLPRQVLPGSGDSIGVADLRAAGVRGVDIGLGANSGVQFAISRWDSLSTPSQNITVLVLIDTNRDGVDDWELASYRSTGNQNLAFLTRLAPSGDPAGPTTAYFFTTADLQSSNWILTVPVRPTYNGAPADVVLPNQPFNFKVQGLDNYFTGVITDEIGTMTYQLNAPKFTNAVGAAFELPVNFSGSIPVSATGTTAPSSQQGFLLMWRDGQPGREASLVTVN